MRINLIILLMSCVSVSLSAQDTTTIQNDDLTLTVQEMYIGVKPFYNRKTSSKNQVTNFHFRGSVLDIIERWIEVAEFEKIEFKIDGSRYKFRLRNFEDSTLIFNKVFDVLMVSKQEENTEVNYKNIQRTAFEAFAELADIEITKKKISKTFWELNLISENNPSISLEQNKFWSRSDLEEYIYYERIDIRRVSDLLGRKLDSFVRPMPHNFVKYDIKMPYSNDFFDLKYSMIEHGFELMEVTKEIEVWIIKI